MRQVLMVLLWHFPFCGAVNRPAGGDTAMNQVRRVMIWYPVKCIYKFNFGFLFSFKLTRRYTERKQETAQLMRTDPALPTTTSH